MKHVLLATFVLVASLSLVSGEILGPTSENQELFIYQQKIYVAHQLLQTECPNYLRNKRALLESSAFSFHLKVAKRVYKQLIDSLIECHAIDAFENASTIAVATASPVATTTTPITATTTSTAATATSAAATTTSTAATTTSTAATTTSTAATTTSTSTTQQPVSKDCQQLYERGERTAGVYEINILNSGLRPFQVWCDFLDGHGWVVFQKRVDGSADFYRDWSEYKNGFGSPSGEYWLGNDRIHALTQTNQILNIYVEEADGDNHTGTWNKFYISAESDNYKLTVDGSGYGGSLAESTMGYHNGTMYSTKDRDNDSSRISCAVVHKGAWWYNSCYQSNFNGPYNNYNGFSIANHPSNLVTTIMRVTRN